MVKYQEFIEENFLILDKDSQQPVPFRFRWKDSEGIEHAVQEKYYQLLQKDYPKLEGIREIVLKARQEGISSFVLALFTVDFIFRPYSVSICISHRQEATNLLFRKVKFYLDSYCQKNGINVKDYLLTDNKSMIESKYKHSLFYVQTAGTKVGGRGSSATNVLFSEMAFYSDTELITAQEIVLGTSQQVPQGKGMIFIESTANGENGFYHSEWERAQQFDKEGKRRSSYTPRFFGWDQFYTPEWIEQKRKEFPTEAMFLQEYPLTSSDAFLRSGTPFFDKLLLQEMMNNAPEPIFFGRLAPDGSPL